MRRRQAPAPAQSCCDGTSTLAEYEIRLLPAGPALQRALSEVCDHALARLERHARQADVLAYRETPSPLKATVSDERKRRAIDRYRPL